MNAGHSRGPFLVLTPMSATKRMHSMCVGFLFFFHQQGDRRKAFFPVHIKCHIETCAYSFTSWLTFCLFTSPLHPSFHPPHHFTPSLGPCVPRVCSARRKEGRRQSEWEKGPKAVQLISGCSEVGAAAHLLMKQNNLVSQCTIATGLRLNI